MSTAKRFAWGICFLAGVALAEKGLEAVDAEIQKNLDFFYYMEVVEAAPVLKAMREVDSRRVTKAKRPEAPRPDDKKGGSQ